MYLYEFLVPFIVGCLIFQYGLWLYHVIIIKYSVHPSKEWSINLSLCYCSCLGVSWWEGTSWHFWTCWTSWQTRSPGASWKLWREGSYCEFLEIFRCAFNKKFWIRFQRHCPSSQRQMTNNCLSSLFYSSCSGWERPYWPGRSWWSAGSRGSARPCWITWSIWRGRRQGQ